MKTHVVSRKNQIRSILFVALLMAITIIVIVREYSITEIFSAIEGTNPLYLLAGIVLIFVYLACQALNISMILRRIESPISFGYCLEYVFVGNYFGGITPEASGAQPSQIYYMNKDKIRLDIAALTVYLMVFANHIVILGLGLVFTVLRSDMVSGFPVWLKYLIIAGGILLVIMNIVLIALMFMKKTVPFLFRIGLKIGVKSHLVKNSEEANVKFEEMMLSYRDKSMLILKHPVLFLKVLVVTVVQWISYYMVSYMVYLSFGYHNHNAVDLMAGQSFVSLAVTPVPIPGSVGAAENAYLKVFSQFYQMQDLPSAMILSRLINFYVLLFISFLIYLIVHFRVVKQKKLQQKQMYNKKKG